MWTETYNFYTQGFIAFLPPLVGLLITLFGIYAIRITRREQKSEEHKDGCVMPFLFSYIAFGLLWTTGVGYQLGVPARPKGAPNRGEAAAEQAGFGAFVARKKSRKRHYAHPSISTSSRNY